MNGDRPAHAEQPANGLLVVDKPAGWTSHDVVAKVRGIAHTRKVGHAGTLDPMATGVLILGLNKATRLLGHLSLTDKTYLATARLGVSTVSDDADGEITTATGAAELTDDEIRSAAAAFVGSIEQVPSSVSAIKVDGKRSYARVRAGEDVALASRTVTIASLDVGSIDRFDIDGTTVVDVALTVSCSSGTYIRALARDLGVALGTGGHLTALRRTAVGPFTLADTVTLDELGALADAPAGSSTGPALPVISLDDVAGRLFPRLDLDETAAADVRTGRRLTGLDTTDLPSAAPIAVFGPAGEFLALYERGTSVLRPVAVFV